MINATNNVVRTTILVVDDHPGLREGLIMLLRRDPAFDVIATAANGREALESAARLQPDVIIMDIKMPVLGGLEATALLSQQRSKSLVVILAASDDEDLMRQAFQSGAAAYVLKDDAVTDLIPAVHAARQGHSFVSASITVPLPDADRRKSA